MLLLSSSSQALLGQYRKSKIINPAPLTVHLPLSDGFIGAAKNGANSK
jgi:hypothetical protein